MGKDFVKTTTEGESLGMKNIMGFPSEYKVVLHEERLAFNNGGDKIIKSNHWNGDRAVWGRAHTHAEFAVRLPAYWVGSEKEKKMTKEQILEKLKEQGIVIGNGGIIEVYYVGDVGDKRFKKGSFVSAPSLTCYPTKERAVEDFHVGSYISRSDKHSIREQLKQVNDELWLVSISVDDIISIHSHGIEMEVASLKCVKKIEIPSNIEYLIQDASFDWLFSSINSAPTNSANIRLTNTLTGNYLKIPYNYADPTSIKDLVENFLKADDLRVKILRDTKDGIKIDI